MKEQKQEWIKQIKTKLIDFISEINEEFDNKQVSYLFNVDNRLVDSDVFSIYTGLENYFDCFIHSFKNYEEIHNIVNTILGIKSLRKKALRYVRNGNYMPNHFIEKVKTINNYQTEEHNLCSSNK